MSTTGQLLVAAPILEDPNFARTVVLVLDHDDDGAIGVVLNRPSDMTVDGALAPWASHIAAPRVVFGGGPVEPTAIVAVGRATVAAATDDWSPIFDRVRLVSLDVEPDDMTPELERLRIFAGYAGWGPGQLDEELAADAWFPVPPTPGDVFTAQPDDLWSTVLRRQPDRLRLFATYPLNPSLN
jgi:putative transcriptional regulator